MPDSITATPDQIMKARISMAAWQQPDGVVGDSSFIRVSLGVLGPQRYRCPARDAMAARPNLVASVGVRQGRELLESFTLGPFMTALDLIEDRRFTADQALITVREHSQRPIHDGVLQWTTHAIRAYLDAFPSDADRSMRPVRSRWTSQTRLGEPDDRGARRYEMNVWGRCYVSSDGRVRELRLIANRLNARSRGDAEIAVAALVVAKGSPGRPPKRVRIVQFGVLEGAAETLFDNTPEAAAEMYRLHAKAALASIVDSTEYRPGAACADCQFASVCPKLPRQPGLLGVPDFAKPRRSWSATNARSYRNCPAQDYLRQQRLPVDATIEQSAAAERGRAVHAFLERRHGQAERKRCDLHVPSDWVPAGYELTDDDRGLGARLLRQHAEICPLRYANEVKTEPDLAYDDTDANVVVLVKPDLLYEERGAWVWREVKTSGSDRRRPADVLVEYPQLALGIVLVARGAFGLGRGRVELEVLRPGGADLMMFDPFTDGVRKRAERVLLDHVRAWRADDRFAAVPGDGCRRCEVSRWCSAKAGAAV
ncbi:PD-(D/E)XK nuclease family protein [Micromonospora sp. NPDC005979]|uniref:PD-(D/E)XK nuclease family protein n=1 Tax=Micromonospora sp. NPDC005979 TaxID=3156726 RepID=UPI0033B9F834